MRSAELALVFQLNLFGGSAFNHRQRLEEIMKTDVRDKAEGALHEVKGKVKEVTGKLTDNLKLEAEGEAKIAGKVQVKRGDVKKVFGI